jgi:hypothetical protein
LQANSLFVEQLELRIIGAARPTASSSASTSD